MNKKHFLLFLPLLILALAACQSAAKTQLPAQPTISSVALAFITGTATPTAAPAAQPDPLVIATPIRELPSTQAVAG